MNIASRILTLLIPVFFFECSDAPAEGQNQEVKKVTAETEFANSLQGIPLGPGVAGIFTLPEMLCLSVADSTRASEAAESVARSYAVLDEELQNTRAVRNGPYGQISYSNDTANFKYECFVLINKIPDLSPQRAKVVVLETTRAVAFNYYGPYQELHVAYAQLKDHLARNGLVQWGPMREYYITDPRRQPDPERWRTLVIVPVRKG